MPALRVRTQILVAFGLEGYGSALGNVWRITTKRRDFYLDPLGLSDAFHLSAHGPRYGHSAHRFHVKTDASAVRVERQRGNLLVHTIPQDGYAFDGIELASGAFLVARLRWLWDLQRPMFREASTTGRLPHVSRTQSGAILGRRLAPNVGC
jgi:hypothetical protein